MSKADRLRRLKRKRETRDKPVASVAAPVPVRGQTGRDRVVRPTQERMRRGQWHEPANQLAPAFDAECDMIATLYSAGQITAGQHDAARLFQQIVASWIAELALNGYRSCLDFSGGGYDAGDGDPSAKARNDAIKVKLGVVCYLYLRSEVEKPGDARPSNIVTLRNALDKINR